MVAVHTMKGIRIFMLFILVCVSGCSDPKENAPDQAGGCDAAENNIPADAPYATVRGALLGSRFKSLDELKSVIKIEYFNSNADSDSTIHSHSKVSIRHCSGGREVVSILESGVSQGDIAAAKDGDFGERLGIVFCSPYAVSNRKDLESIFLLARVRPNLFGEGDVAFFSLAQTTFRNINTPELAFINPRDSTEKGYINSFNHITAQAFITSCFSEELADFVGDSHERYFHPELITGKFPQKEITDLAEGPVDNYVDLVNNEWGQELGKQLKAKYNISRKTMWTPELLANYLNDMQEYYSWAFQIGFKPFKPEDEQVIKFARKMNAVMNGNYFEN